MYDNVSILWASDVLNIDNVSTSKITKDKEGPIPERALSVFTSLFTLPLRLPTSTNSDNMPISKQEQQLFDAIRAVYYGKIRQSYRPGFLKNNRTGNNLEIDIFLEKYRIGLEFQGAIHFKEIYKYKNNPDKSRYNDTLKDSFISKSYSWISIIEIFETDLSGDIISNVVQRCRNTQILYFQKRFYMKCYLLERLIQNLQHADDNVSKTWFKLIHKILHPGSNKEHGRKFWIGNLIGFYLTNKDRLPSGEMYDMDKLSKVERFDSLYNFRKQIRA